MWFVYFVVLIFGFANLAEDLAPRLAGAGVALEFRERLVERLPFGWSWRAAVQKVGFVEFGEPGEDWERSLTVSLGSSSRI